MILATRVDYRLLHGQVAVSWTSGLGANCILIANDKVATDSVRKSAMRLAKPQGVKLVIKNIEDSIKAINSGVTDKYRLFVVVDSIDDVYKLVQGCNQIKSVNLGLTTTREGTKNISKNINITGSEEEKLKVMVNNGIEVEIRAVPDDHKVLIKNIL
ncbi:PTS sugar transporter subunit IIB [Companilactobacillus halodurans]|uniref:PTS sugar transporter subunit IIB n=1 Tax=Companilactobacillus halodurans TaxID=2584183 RepID=A0A5P1A069_9LACO|nr:PTS sugar transporter subunit IIB [Companilactobacillus halodurans]MQS98597.1 PTS sugar transporter subunit IIB [Companilactobacillus halodurans]